MLGIPYAASLMLYFSVRYGRSTDLVKRVSECNLVVIPCRLARKQHGSDEIPLVGRFFYPDGTYLGRRTCLLISPFPLSVIRIESRHI